MKGLSRWKFSKEFKQAAERAYLQGKLQEHDWTVSETARSLQMPRSNLYKKIERYGLARGGSTGGGGSGSGGGGGDSGGGTV